MIIIIIIIIIIMLAITFVQCTYNDIPETNHVPTVHSVAAVLYLQFMVQYLHVMLFPMLNTFRTTTSALPAVSGQRPILLFSAVP